MSYMKMSLIKRMFCPQKQLEQYHRNLRKYEYDNGLPVRGLSIRRAIHGLVLLIIKAECLFSNVHIKVVGDASVPTDKPVIYASTHIGRYDVESNFLSHKRHFYVFYGDPGSVYRSFDGLLLHMNGVIYADTDSKIDRMVGKETCIKLLKQGGNLLIYPEGAWNITENQPVMNLYTGTVEMAIRSGAEIVPIAMENHGNTYYVNIGKNIDCSKVPLEKKREKTDELRDILGVLKWVLWESQGIQKRSDIPNWYADTFLNNIMSQTTPDYTVEEIIRTRFHDDVSSPEEAFMFEKNLIPKRENAFLFRKAFDRNNGKCEI